MATQPTEIIKTTRDRAVDALSAGLSSGPFTGGLATYLGIYYPGQQKRMMDNFFETLMAHAAEIDAVQCDVDKLGALVTEALVQSARTASEVKREAFRAIVLNYAEGKPATEYKVEMFTQTVAALSELQIRMLRIAKDPADAAGAAGLVNSEGKATKTSDKITMEELILGSEIALNRLAYHDLLQRGLLTQRASLPGPDYQPVTLWFLHISDLGGELLEWISRPA